MDWKQASGVFSRRNRLYPPRGCHVVVVSSLPSGVISKDSCPTQGEPLALLAISRTCCAQRVGREITQHTPQTPTKCWGPR